VKMTPASVTRTPTPTSTTRLMMAASSPGRSTRPVSLLLSPERPGHDQSSSAQVVRSPESRDFLAGGRHAQATEILRYARKYRID
jgi:hypothetical protein